jgi:hypothetical protein
MQIPEGLKGHGSKPRSPVESTDSPVTAQSLIGAGDRVWTEPDTAGEWPCVERWLVGSTSLTGLRINRKLLKIDSK